QSSTRQDPHRAQGKGEVREKNVVVVVDEKATHSLADAQSREVEGLRVVRQRRQSKSVVAMRCALYTGALASMRYFIVSAPEIPCSANLLRMLK
ncbi:MAG: hypothetical protein RI908_1421, partial [Actinomycetota bacterium]